MRRIDSAALVHSDTLAVRALAEQLIEHCLHLRLVAHGQRERARISKLASICERVDQPRFGLGRHQPRVAIAAASRPYPWHVCLVDRERAPGFCAPHINLRDRDEAADDAKPPALEGGELRGVHRVHGRWVLGGESGT